MRHGIWAIAALLATLSVAAAEESINATSAQPPTSQAAGEKPSPGPLQFQGVVMVEGATRDQLYDAAVLWFGRTFQSSKDVLQVQSRESGTLIGKALFTYEPVVFAGKNGIRGVVRYTVTIEMKDGRYRYTIDNFIHEGNPTNVGGQFSVGLLTTDEKCPRAVFGPSPSGREETWKDLKKKATVEAERLAKSLKEKLTTAATEKAW